MRFRYHIVTRRGIEETALLAEECDLLGFTGAPEAARWLDAVSAGNIAPAQAASFVRQVVEGYGVL